MTTNFDAKTLQADRLDAVQDLRKAIEEGATDEWLLGFVQGYPFTLKSVPAAQVEDGKKQNPQPTTDSRLEARLSRQVVETEIGELRKILMDASIIGTPVPLSHLSAGVLAFALGPVERNERPPGSQTCYTCNGAGVTYQCVICGSEEAGSGTCGSDSPRALCNFPGIALPADTIAPDSKNPEAYAPTILSNKVLKKVLQKEFDLGDFGAPTPVAIRAARAAMVALAKSNKADSRGADTLITPEGYRLVKVQPDNAMQLAGANAIRIDTTAINKVFTANRVFVDMCNASTMPSLDEGKSNA